MKVFIIGGGINGLSTAYWLSKNNIKTIIIEKNNNPCQEASMINGCQHSYSKITPLITMSKINNIGIFNCWPLFESIDFKWLGNLALSRLNLNENTMICNWLSIQSKILFEREFPNIQKYKPIQQVYNHLGYKYLQPNSYSIKDNIVTYTNDYVTNPIIFNNELLNRCNKLGAEIIKSKLKKIVYKENSNIIADIICDPPLPYKFNLNDKVIITAGAMSKKFIPTLPMISVYGGSIFNVNLNNQSAPCFITSGYQNIKMANHTRVVFGTIFSNSYVPSSKVICKLQGYFPNAKIYARPVSADGLPIIDKISDNLFVCTGQGFFGYTLGLFSGKIASKLIQGEKLTKKEQYLNLNRFWF